MRLKEETEFRPKPMVTIGERPILWHIMKSYSDFGFRKFVLALGFKGDVVKDYFLHYDVRNRDFTIDLATSDVTKELEGHDEDWTVTLVDTGEASMTGARVCRAVAKYLGDAEHFAVTYGDGVTDVDLSQEFEWHRAHGRIGTVLGVNAPSRFGEFEFDDSGQVTAFTEKPDALDAWINGGYFFFRREFLDYVSPDPRCVLEQEPLVKLAADGQLSMFKHPGFWACMDTQRDRQYLADLVANGEAPWMGGE